MTINTELLEALKDLQRQYSEHPDAFWDWSKARAAIQRAESAVSEPVKPVAWLVPDDSVNSLVVASIERLIELCKAAHHADIKVRVNGQDQWFEADWVKYLKRATPPAAVPLSDEQIAMIWKSNHKTLSGWDYSGDEVMYESDFDDAVRAVEAAHGIGEKQ